jgi:transcriptional regulator with XRE-family HTH domain
MTTKKPGPQKGTKHSEIKRSDFGERLFKARKARGLTQQQLADKINMTRRMIAYYESETDEGPTIRGLRDITDALNITAAYLLGESTQKKIDTDIPETLKKHISTLVNLPTKDQKKVIDYIELLAYKKDRNEKLPHSKPLNDK